MAALLFLLIAARANTGEALSVLGRNVAAAASGQWIVVIENEHSDESTARILKKSCDRLGVGYEALDRIVLVARGNVRLGSAVWQDVERLMEAGLVSDVILDTLARCAAADANDEQEQVEVFATISNAIELAPSAETRPTFWVAAHTRKCEGTPTLNDRLRWRRSGLRRARGRRQRLGTGSAGLLARGLGCRRKHHPRRDRRDRRADLSSRPCFARPGSSEARAAHLLASPSRRRERD